MDAVADTPILSGRPNVRRVYPTVPGPKYPCPDHQSEQVIVVGSVLFGAGIWAVDPESVDAAAVSVKPSGAVIRALSCCPVSGDAGWREPPDADEGDCPGEAVDPCTADEPGATGEPAAEELSCPGFQSTFPEEQADNAMTAKATAVQPIRDPVVTRVL